jgi:hypothetical protein
MATFEETVLAKLDQILAAIKAIPAGGDGTTRTAEVTAGKSLAHFASAMNGAGKPIMEIYPSETSKAPERIRFDQGATVKVMPGVIKADSGSEWYALDAAFVASVKKGVNVPLYINKADVRFV